MMMNDREKFDGSKIEWRIETNPIDYQESVVQMETRVAEIAAGAAAEMIWCVEHPPLYTAGTSAQTDDLLDARFPVYQSGRGGQYTYHGPGQRVVYVMLDLKRHYQTPDIRAFVRDLEEWIIQTLAQLGVVGERRAGRIGIWVPRPDTAYDDKIAALGIRIRRGVSYHGFAINVQPNLDHFKGIIPCGITGHGVTSFAQMGRPVTMANVDQVLKQTILKVFPNVVL